MGCHSCCCCCCLSRATAVFTQTQTETGWAEVKHTTPNCHLVLCFIPFCDAHTVYLLHQLHGLQIELSALAPLLPLCRSFCAFSVWGFFFLEAMMDGFAPLDFSVTAKCVFAWLLVRPTEGWVSHSPDPYTVSDRALSCSLSLALSLSLCYVV